ncbi:hypothetical protein D3C83_197830 [compost metagenome]
MELATHLYLDEPEYTSEAEYREAVESFVSNSGGDDTSLGSSQSDKQRWEERGRAD